MCTVVLCDKQGWLFAPEEEVGEMCLRVVAFDLRTFLLQNHHFVSTKSQNHHF